MKSDPSQTAAPVPDTREMLIERFCFTSALFKAERDPGIQGALARELVTLTQQYVELSRRECRLIALECVELGERAASVDPEIRPDVLRMRDGMGVKAEGAALVAEIAELRKQLGRPGGSHP